MISLIVIFFFYSYYKFIMSHFKINIQIKDDIHIKMKLFLIYSKSNPNLIQIYMDIYIKKHL